MKRKAETVAVLTIQGPVDSKKMRHALVEWLQDMADFVEVDNAQFSKRFRARFLRVPHE